MSELSVTISNLDFVMLTHALKHIKKINNSILSIDANYVSTDNIDNNEGKSIMLHYDNWIANSDNPEDDDKELSTLITELMFQSSQILIRSAYNIPANYIKSNHPKFDYIMENHSKLNEAYDGFAEMMKSNFVSNQNTLREKLLENNPQFKQFENNENDD